MQKNLVATKKQQARQQGSSVWDYLIPVGIGGILLLWRGEISNWWGKHYTPTSPSCVLHLSNLGEGNLIGAAIMFAIVAACAYLYIRGQRRLLRAIRVSAFLGIVVCLLRGGPAVKLSIGWSEGFAQALGKFEGWVLTVGVGAVLALALFLCLIGYLFKQTTKEIWESTLLGINAFAFLELEWAANVKRWGEISLLAFLGAAAAIFEMMFYVEKISRLQVLVTAIVGVVWYTFVGVTGYRIFLAAWGPRLCW